MRATAACEEYGFLVKWSGVREIWNEGRSKHVKETCFDSTWADDNAAITVSHRPAKLLEQARSMAAEPLDTCTDPAGGTFSKPVGYGSRTRRRGRPGSTRRTAGNSQLFISSCKTLLLCSRGRVGKQAPEILMRLSGVCRAGSVF